MLIKDTRKLKIVYTKTPCTSNAAAMEMWNRAKEQLTKVLGAKSKSPA